MLMKNNHTPGKWTVKGNQIISDGTYVAMAKAGRKSRSNISEYQYLNFQDDSEEIQANTRIISAAPRVTEALTEAYIHLLNHMDERFRATEEGQRMLVRTRAALQEAYGVTDEECQVWHEQQAIAQR